MRKCSITNAPVLDYNGKETMNAICTNISFSGKNIKKIALTSCVASEGKSTMSARILLNLAARGQSVLLLDADLRRSNLVNSLGLRSEDGTSLNGLAHYLTGHCEMEDAIYSTNYNNAYIMPIGRNISNPLPLLDSREFDTLLNRLDEACDAVIIDTPPLGLVVDAAEIIKHCDGVIIVIEYGKRHRREVQNVINQVRRTGCPILGVIIDKVTVRSYTEKRYYRDHYSYGYYKKYYNNKTSNKDE